MGQLLTGRRALFLGFTIAAVLVGGWRALIPGTGVSSRTGDVLAGAVTAARDAASGSTFADAEAELAAFRVLQGTYAGARLSTADPVTLVWAGASSYCLQSQAPATVAHEVGPSGRPQPGACPG